MTPQRNLQDTYGHKDIELECKSLQDRSILADIQMLPMHHPDSVCRHGSEWGLRILLGNNGHNDKVQVYLQCPMGRSILLDSSYRTLQRCRSSLKRHIPQFCSAGSQCKSLQTIHCIL